MTVDELLSILFEAQDKEMGSCQVVVSPDYEITGVEIRPATLMHGNYFIELKTRLSEGVQYNYQM